MIIVQCLGLVLAKLPQADEQSSHQVDPAIIGREISQFFTPNHITTLSSLFSCGECCHSQQSGGQAAKQYPDKLANTW